MESSAQLITKLSAHIDGANLPADVAERLKSELARVEALTRGGENSAEIDKIVRFVEFVSTLPWEKVGQDNLDINHAKGVLEKNHYGLESVKTRILEYLSILILNAKQGQAYHSVVLAFVGLAGSGKTTLAKSIAESLNRPFVRIPFGGLGSALALRGESRVKPEAQPGLLMKWLSRVQVKNPVVLLDEIDRVTTEARSDIMGVLIELLDPEQNQAFLDYYVDIPFDLSRVLFVATANNLTNVSTAVLDRLEVIEMPFYSDEQKVVIAKDYLLPQAVKDAGLPSGSVVVDPNLWMEVVRPLGFDGGIRSLKRNIDTVVRKIAKLVVEGRQPPFNVTGENIRQFLEGN